MAQINHIKVLRIKCNRSRASHNLALENARRVKVGILVISEPNINVIRDRKDWALGTDFKTTIEVVNHSISNGGQGEGSGTPPSIAVTAPEMTT